MSTKRHNEICAKFKTPFFKQRVKSIFRQEEIFLVEIEKLVSNYPSNLGFIDVFIKTDEMDLIIEVKSSVEIVREDTLGVIRQLKRYQFLYGKPSKMVLIYDLGDDWSNGLTPEEKSLFEDEGIQSYSVHLFENKMV